MVERVRKRAKPWPTLTLVLKDRKEKLFQE